MRLKYSNISASMVSACTHGSEAVERREGGKREAKQQMLAGQRKQAPDIKEPSGGVAPSENNGKFPDPESNKQKKNPQTRTASNNEAANKAKTPDSTSTDGSQLHCHFVGLTDFKHRSLTTTVPPNRTRHGQELQRFTVRVVTPLATARKPRSRKRRETP